MGEGRHAEGFDGAAAVTRSLLGYGVIAGPVYLAVGVTLALTRTGFDFASHPLSVLMLGDLGWIQRVNLILAGAMAIAAALGFARALTGTRAARWVGGLLATYGAALVASGIFPPDPMEGFPPGTSAGDPSVSGVLHLAAGGVGFLALAGAAVAVGAWFASRATPRVALVSRVAAVVILVGFMGGAALATNVIGILLLWLAVVAGWAWLAWASVRTYRTVPHPDHGVAATSH